jgi:hypothetical protein
MVPTQLLSTAVPVRADPLSQATYFRDQGIARQLGEILVHMSSAM